MAKRRQFYTYKFETARLKHNKYNINITFEEAIKNGEVIALFDNQFLRSIRNIKNEELNLELLDELIDERNKLKKKSTNKDMIKEMKRLTEKINNILYVPEYITVVIEHNSHYRHIFENGLILNDKKYVRFSSSAGQGRKKTIVMIEEEISKELYRVLNNDRKEIKLAPSKFNAYFGLNSSATQVFTTPSICIIPDYYSSTNVKMSWVTETDWDSDDIIEVVEKEMEFNRFDGMGLVTPRFANVMANDLGLDYTPAQFCIRQNFTKGMICVFDVLDFCEKKNGGNTIITDIYGTEVDLKDIDIILTESMCKLWNAFDSTQDYVDKCAKNKLDWGVSIYTPKEEDMKNILKMNYQFIQTLDLDDNDIKELCSQTIEWLQGVSGDNIDYTKLFLMGTNPNIDNYNNYMYKCLFAEPELINDKYISGKIKDLLKNRIEKACLGEIYVDGNFQVLIADPYGLMQHCCGLPVTGLLDKGAYFAHYWNKRNVKVVDSMRSPMTYRSEHVILDLVDNDEVNYWYKHCYCGVILNIHGHETTNYAGADHDYDTIATTNNPVVIGGVYKDELPIICETPKPSKTDLSPEKLYVADLFTFGSIIGSITNKSTSGFALLPYLEEVYGKDSKEYNATLNRIKMCTKLQAWQIDKAKIGQNVKGIPKPWINRLKIDELDDEITIREKEFNNSILLDRHPYFFSYLYKDTRRKYNKHKEFYDLNCKVLHGVSLDELFNKENKTDEELEYIRIYNKYSPVIDTPCVMNNLCRYMESIRFDIRNKVKTNSIDVFGLLFDNNIEFNDNNYKKIKEKIKEMNKKIAKEVSFQAMKSQRDRATKGDIFDNLEEIRFTTDQQVQELFAIVNNEDELLNYVIKCVYHENITRACHLLWEGLADVLFRRLINRCEYKISIPTKDADGELEYLGKKYSISEVFIGE